MKKIFEYNTQGKTLHMELKLSSYEHNRTLAVLLYEKGCEKEDGYYTLTCCLDDAPGKNRAFIDVNNMGDQIVDALETAGFGRRTGRTTRSGFVSYPEFEFDAEVLKTYTNKDYEDYLKWQDALKEDEEYLVAECCICCHAFPLMVKKSAAEKYRRYLDGERYLIQDIFPDMPAGDRGLLARGQNMCNACFQEMFGMKLI